MINLKKQISRDAKFSYVLAILLFAFFLIAGIIRNDFILVLVGIGGCNLLFITGILEDLYGQKTKKKGPDKNDS